MPAFAEHHPGRVVRLLDEGMHVAVARDALGIGILGEGPEAQAEGLVGLVREALASQIDHLVAE